jgi:hypothetical protein
VTASRKVPAAFFPRSRPHRRCWTSRPDLGGRWPSRLVAPPPPYLIEIQQRRASGVPVASEKHARDRQLRALDPRIGRCANTSRPCRGDKRLCADCRCCFMPASPPTGPAGGMWTAAAQPRERLAYRRPRSCYLGNAYTPPACASAGDAPLPLTLRSADPRMPSQIAGRARGASRCAATLADLHGPHGAFGFLTRRISFAIAHNNRRGHGFRSPRRVSSWIGGVILVT